MFKVGDETLYRHNHLFFGKIRFGKYILHFSKECIYLSHRPFHHFLNHPQAAKTIHINFSAILTPSKTKKETAVDIREEDGEKYSAVLTPRNEARDVTLHFALYNKTKAGWLKKYFAFINFLKKGKDGWLDIAFPQLDLTLRVR